MSKSYDVPAASATWVDPTGQTEYTMTWTPDGNYLSGVNLNTGTAWDLPNPCDDPNRFGPSGTPAEFFAWIAKFVAAS